MRTPLLTLLIACTGAVSKPVDHVDSGGDSGGDSGTDSGTDSGPLPCTLDDVDPVGMLEHVIAGTASDCEVEAFTDFAAARTVDIGPWKQDIRMAHSADALNFTALDGVVIESAAVPEVVVGPDGRTFLFHVDGRFDHAVALAEARSPWMTTHGVPGLGALALSVSEDGRTFTPVDDFAVEGLVQGMIVDPEVVRQPDGSWRMYYVGMTASEYLTTATWEYPESHEVFWASSTDLVHWRQEGSAVRGPFADPTVYCSEGDRCVMASFGLEWSRSTDGGATFTHDGSWGLDGFAPEFMRFEDGTSRLYFNSGAKGAAIQSFRLNEELIWELEEGARMPETYGEAVTLAPAASGGWNMWFHVFKDGSEPAE